MNEQTRLMLETAREYVRRGWCQTHNALDDHDWEVSAEDETACKWCLHGALNVAGLLLLFRSCWCVLGAQHLVEQPEYLLLGTTGRVVPVDDVSHHLRTVRVDVPVATSQEPRV